MKQATHYYPYGDILSQSTNHGVQKFKYNGKEMDRMYGLDTYDHGARQYNPARITWDRIDPLCQKYYHISPYVYCAGNPIRYVDPDGRWIANVTGALAGEVFELGTQLAGQYISKGSIDWGEVDWADVAISTLEGGLTCGSSIVKNATKKSAISASAAVARVIIDKDHISNKMQENALDEVAGHVGGK